MRESTRYLLVLAVAALLLLTVLGLYGDRYPINFANHEYVEWRHRMDAVGNAAISAELLLIGDSRGVAGFAPEQVTATALNLALGGATPVEAWFLLDRWLARHPAPRDLVLSFGPFHLSEMDSFWHRTVKFGFLSAREVDALRRESEMLGVPLDEQPFSRMLSTLIPPFSWSAELFSGLLAGRRAENLAALAAFERAKGHKLYGTGKRPRNTNEEAGRFAFEPSPLMDIYLRRTIRLAREHGIRVHWFTMPFSEVSWSKTLPRYRFEFNRYLRDLAAEEGVHVARDLWSLPDEYFGDPSHVNAEGVKLVTAALMASLDAPPGPAATPVTPVTPAAPDEAPLFRPAAGQP